MGDQLLNHSGKIVLAAWLLAVPALATAPPDNTDWNQWRGPKRDGHSPDTGLLKQWPSGGPPLAWKATGIGAGYSSVAVQGDRIFTMGDVGDDCILVAMSLDGKIVWTAKVSKASGPKDQGGYPGPRCTPSTDGKIVVALGGFGDLVCVDRADGKEMWRKNLESDLGGKTPHWGYSESPLIDGNTVVCIPGGKQGSVVALNKETGATVWKSDALQGNAEYTSLMPVEIGGVAQYLVVTKGTCAGIAAKDGKVLWKGSHPGGTAVIATPVYADGIVFMTVAYGVGCKAFKISSTGGAFSAEVAYTDEGNDKKSKILDNKTGGVIVVGEHVYGVTDGGKLKCVELKTGKVVWEDRCVGCKGSVAFADGHLVVRGEDGRGAIVLVEATPEGYKEKGRFDQPERSKKTAWPHPVVFGGKLYIRDQDVLLCFDVKAK
jgi:outer membrane protein assembly factor BamB